MAKYLIVNADDYGIAASVSQGIRESHQRGIVTSTTVMIGMDNAAGALQGNSMLNGGADTTGRLGLEGRVIGAHDGVAAPIVLAAHGSAATR